MLLSFGDLLHVVYCTFALCISTVRTKWPISSSTVSIGGRGHSRSRKVPQIRKTVSLRDQFLASEKNYRASLLRYKTRIGWVLGLSPASAHSSHKSQEERNTAFKHLTPSVGVIVILASFSCISRSVGGLRDRDPFRSHPLIRTSDNQSRT